MHALQACKHGEVAGCIHLEDVGGGTVPDGLKVPIQHLRVRRVDDTLHNRRQPVLAHLRHGPGVFHRAGAMPVS